MTQRLFIDGHAIWSSQVAGERPVPAMLVANERRRAPDSVLVALDVAQRAVQASGHDVKTLASVFTSAHGDLAIVDALCTTLARDPTLLSPTRFHHSVHNAASGYWAIAAGSRAPSTALSGHLASFATGLLEAACQCEADARAVLLTGVDTDARGALASVNASRGLLGVALVLAPARSAHSRWSLGWSLAVGAHRAPAPAALAALAGNAMADALPLFEALAAERSAAMTLPLGANLALALDLQRL
jgi:Beta-ketoacyl synthase, N-terminal domain